MGAITIGLNRTKVGKWIGLGAKIEGSDPLIFTGYLHMDIVKKFI